MTPLVIDEKVRAAIAACIAYAEANPVTKESIAGVKAGTIPAVGDNPAHSVMVPMGFRCVFSVDQVELPKGGARWVRHLSVSVAVAAERLVSPEGLQVLMQEFGFKHSVKWALSNGYIWEEPLFDSGTAADTAMNVMEFREAPKL